METVAKKIRVRGTNFTKNEELFLVQTVLKYKNIIESKNSNDVSGIQKEQAWATVHTEFLACNSPRTLEQIKSKYDNLKTAARKYAAANAASLRKTGGRPQENIVYDTMLEILNCKTVFGLQNKLDDDGVGLGAEREERQEQGEEQPDQEEEVVVVEVDPELDKDDSKDGGTQWNKYSPAMLKRKKNKKFMVRNKPQARLTATLYALKKKYLEEKLEHLRQKEKRHLEEHMRRIELLNLEIKKKKSCYCESD